MAQSKVLLIFSVYTDAPSPTGFFSGSRYRAALSSDARLNKIGFHSCRACGVTDGTAECAYYHRAAIAFSVRLKKFSASECAVEDSLVGALVGRRRRRVGKSTIRCEIFGHGYVFAQAFAVMRMLWAQ